MITLRDYQSDLEDKVRLSMSKGSKRVLMVLPTGGGKTVIFSDLASKVSSKGSRVYILAHREELLEQISGTLKQFNVPHGIVAPGFPFDMRQKVQVCSEMTFIKRMKRIPQPNLIIKDEAHRAIPKSTSGKIINHFNTWTVGVTATPKRLSGEPLGDIFDDIVLGPSTASLIEQGYLSKYRLFAPSTIDTSGIATRMGDFSKAQLSEASNKRTITGSAIAEYRKYADRKRAVAFCVSIEHARDVANEFKGHGYRSVWIEGGFDKMVRRMIIKDFREGKIDVLTSCEIISEGFDLPAIECGIMLRPTHSLALHLQQVGRTLRTYPGKEHAIILDHSGNALRHGLPDEDREWSLDGAAKQSKAESAGPSVKICPKCFAAQFSGLSQCKFCGFVFDVKPREVEHEEGELVEVDAATIQNKRLAEQHEAKTLEDLEILGQARGYKRWKQWAFHVNKARQRKKVYGR